MVAEHVRDPLRDFDVTPFGFKYHRYAIAFGLEFLNSVTNEIVDSICDRAAIRYKICLKFSFHRYNPLFKQSFYDFIGTVKQLR